MTERRGSARRIVLKCLPYAGIPLLCAAQVILKSGAYGAFDMLKLEILIIVGYVTAIGDLKTKTIPNKAVLSLLALWIIITAPRLFLDTDAAIQGVKDSAAGFAVGGGLFLFVYIISRRGLGGGDVKFMAAAGLYLGFRGSLTAMLLGAVFAAITGFALILVRKAGRKDTIPLAPFLYAGMLMTMLA